MTADAQPSWFQEAFANPEAVARYTEGPRRMVPGVEGLHRMAGLLLAERAPAGAEILVLGAGGGLELNALAEAQSSWRFTGVDPSAQMLALAERTLGPLASRVRLVEGYIEDAPPGPFDGATCLLTLHFLDESGRRRTLAEIHRRLRPGAAFVAAHLSFPQGPEERPLWLARYAAYSAASGMDPEQAERTRAAVEANLTLLAPDQEEALMREAGFADVSLVYAGLAWRGWVAHA